MPVYIGEIHADVATSGPLTRPAALDSDAAEIAYERVVDGLSRMTWLSARVAAEGSDD